MSVFGLNDSGPIQANDLYVLFYALLTFYGIAFILNLWSRLAISSIRIVRTAFFAVLFILSNRPFLSTLPDLLFPPGGVGHYQWPPYIPPYIAILRGWTSEKEIIMSDVPWAVAWYADRNSKYRARTMFDHACSLAADENFRIYRFKRLPPFARAYCRPLHHATFGRSPLLFRD